jgi:hypothetical protein
MQTTDAILPDILFTGKAQFTHDGIIGTRNRHSFVQQNSPEVVKRNFQQRLSFNVWCGIPGNYTPHFIEGRLIASGYRNILERALLLYLGNATVATTRGMWIDDGAPPYFGRRFTENLNENYQGGQEVDRCHGHLGHRTERPMTFHLLGFHEI